MQHNFLNLKIWQFSRALVKDVYQLSKLFPSNEAFGLQSQIRRSAISIPSNIAEGCGRGSDKQLSHFLGIATGSACELHTQLLLASDLGLLKEEQVEPTISQLIKVRSMIQGFRKTLN